MYIDKEMDLKNGKKLIAYWANNRGRGRNNCTLYVVEKGTKRAGNCKLQNKIDYFTRYSTSSWRGNVNLSRRICKKLEINVTDL